MEALHASSANAEQTSGPTIDRHGLHSHDGDMSANDKKKGKPLAERLQDGIKDVKDAIQDAVESFVEDFAELLAPEPALVPVPIPKGPAQRPPRRR